MIPSCAMIIIFQSRSAKSLRLQNWRSYQSRFATYYSANTRLSHIFDKSQKIGKIEKILFQPGDVIRLKKYLLWVLCALVFE